VLRRPLYRGTIIYGRTAKAYNRELQKVYRGTKREKGQILKPEETWLRRDAPELRIVDPLPGDAPLPRRRVPSGSQQPRQPIPRITYYHVLIFSEKGCGP
jgi:hypothetical protein